MKEPMDFESKLLSIIRAKAMEYTEDMQPDLERTHRNLAQAILEAHREELVREFTSLLSDLPDAVFVPDDASNEAWAGGKGLSVYRLEVQKLLQNRIQALTRIKEEENG